jgi:hypothetical protein
MHSTVLLNLFQTQRTSGNVRKNRHDIYSLNLLHELYTALSADMGFRYELPYFLTYLEAHKMCTFFNISSIQNVDLKVSCNDEEIDPLTRTQRVSLLLEGGEAQQREFTALTNSRSFEQKS